MAKFKSWLIATVVGILISIGGCYGKSLSADVEALKSANAERQVDNADRKADIGVVKKDIQDFRDSFEEFKRDVKDDLARHHSGNR